jgi:hypothetical protein
MAVTTSRSSLVPAAPSRGTEPAPFGGPEGHR